MLQMLQEVHQVLPVGFRHFLKTPEKMYGPASHVNAHRRLLRIISRWHKIQTRVGWVAIALSHAFTSGIVHNGSDDSFADLCDVLATQRHRMIEILESAWPDHPPLLRIIGGIFSRFIELILRGWRRFCVDRTLRTAD